MSKFSQKHLRSVGLAVVSVLFAASAYAQSSGGWTGSVNKIGEFGQAVINALIILCAVGGVGAFAYAGKLLLKKGGDRGDDVEWSKIGYSALAGVFLMAISWVALNSIETMGGGEGDIGKKITIR